MIQIVEEHGRRFKTAFSSLFNVDLDELKNNEDLNSLPIIRETELTRLCLERYNMADMNNSGATSGSLLKAPENLLHPRDYVAPSSANEQSRGETNKILTLSEDQVFNNSGQGMGIDGPSTWGGAESEKASQSSAMAGTKQSNPYSVDLTSGQNSCWNGGNTSSGQ